MTSSNEEFGAGLPTTRWSVVRRAAESDDAGQARVALAELGSKYRGSVHSVLRGLGYSDAETESLTDRFFARLAEPGTLQSAIGGPGSFRAWLGKELDHFLARASAEAEAGPGQGFEAAASQSEPEPAQPWRSELRQSPQHIASYQLVEEIGRGGEATVYRACKLGSEEYVALKLLDEAHLDAPDVIERFRRAAKLSSKLDHENIVKVLDTAGLEDERPFYTMQLVTGRTLAEDRRRERFRDRKRAMQLMIKIARAVHHAHRRGVLHRDVSPSNVLIDLDDEPYLTDFMATWMGGKGAAVAVGALDYMAPEQVFGLGGSDLADVYSLGAVLYDFLSGKPPIEANTLAECREIHERENVASTLKSVAHIDPELDAICRTALSREPGQRHHSAEEFARSLENVLDNRPPAWPAISRKRRIVLWARRLVTWVHDHPVAAAVTSLGVLLLLLADAGILVSLRAERRDLEDAVLRGNATLASSQARAILALFEKYASQSAQAALDPEVLEVVKRGQVQERVPALERILERTRAFDSVGIFTKDGRIIARHPEPAPGFLNREFRFRDYFRCVTRLMEKHVKRPGPGEISEAEVCISPAYRGESSGVIEFTHVAPVRDEDGLAVGFVILNKHAATTLGEIDISDLHRSGQTTAVFGERGPDRHSPARDPKAPKRLTAVAHPGLSNVEERALEPKLARRLIEQYGEQGPPGHQHELPAAGARPLEERDYVDPVTGDRRLAGFAPVGKTGFFVGVSTPTEEAVSTSTRHVTALSRYLGLFNLGFLVLGGVALWASVRVGNPARRS